MIYTPPIVPADMYKANQPRSARAFFASEVLLREFSIQSSTKIGFSGNHHYAEIQNRIIQTLCILQYVSEDQREKCRLSLRYIQSSPDEPLRIYLIGTAINPIGTLALDTVTQLRHAIHAAPLHEYQFETILEPTLQQPTMPEFWFDCEHQNLDISLIEPSVRYKPLPSNKNRMQRLPVFGKWQATIKQFDAVMLAIYRSPRPLIMEVILEPTQLKTQKCRAIEQIYSKHKSIRPSSSTLETSASHLEALLDQRHQLFDIQLRLISPTNITAATAGKIGSSLTTQITEGQIMPAKFSHFKPQRHELSYWAENIIHLEPIRTKARRPLINEINRLATAEETMSVFQLPILTKSRIPELQVANIEELIKKEPDNNASDENNFAQ